MSSPGSAAESDCLVCRELAGEVTLPGGPLIDEELLLGFHVPPQESYERPVLGQLMVVPRRHARGWADLTDAEAAAVGVATTRLARALQATLDPERIYSAVIGHHVPHLHVHVFPRYRGAPAEIAWTELHEWEGTPHGGAEEIAELVGRLRGAVA
jgi:histidine triad (HIT) family protein